MKQIVMIFWLILALGSVAKNQAQSHEEDFSSGEGWVYQEQCLAEPIAPPNNWTWDGTILLRGPYGIHGFNQNWDTTRVLAFVQDRAFSSAVSPDGMWDVRVVGERECGQGMGCGYTYNYARELQIYHLASNENRSAFSIPWNFTELSRHTLSDAARPIWLNNHEFIYSGQPSGEDVRHLSLINVETKVVSMWNGDDIPNLRYRSPDLSRDFSFSQVLNLETGEILGSLVQEDFTVRLYPYETGDLWSPNSAYFLAIDDLDEYQSRLLLYNRNGEYLGSILTATQLGTSPEMTDQIDWSPNGQKFLFQSWVRVENGLDMSSTHLVDIGSHTITNLCANPMTAWSPDGEYLAFNWNSQLSVLDSNFNHYLIRDNSSGYGVLGWRLAE